MIAFGTKRKPGQLNQPPDDLAQRQAHHPRLANGLPILYLTHDGICPTMPDMDAQGRITYRVAKEDEKKAIERIRKHCKTTFGSDDDAAVIRFCITTTDNELSKLPTGKRRRATE